jgi:hypothetical protein
MKHKKLIMIFGILLVALMAKGVYAIGSTNNWQSQQPSFDQLYSGQMQDFWPILTQMENDQCNATSDFIIGIPPGGCTPGVVRSDLLEEQSVPVFCKLYAIKVNPLIKVSSIKSISFPGEKPEGVRDIVFHPARAAVKSYRTLLGDPVINNIGYVVIILKQEKVEKNMEEWVFGNLTAVIKYDAEEAYGTGRAEYFLPEMSDEQWQNDYVKSSFWGGRGHVRLESISGNGAKIQIMDSNKDHVLKTVTLKEGEASDLIYMPGYYCKAGLRVKLNDLVTPGNSTLLNIDGEEFWVREGTKIINNQCKVSLLNIGVGETSEDGFNSGEGGVTITCPGRKTTLELKKKNEGTNPVDLEYDGSLDSYFIKGNQTVEELIEVYRTEMKDGGFEAYGEDALYEQIVLAGESGKFASRVALMQLFVESYPSSRMIEKIRRDIVNSGEYEYENSIANILVGNKFHTVSVVGFDSVKEEDKLASIRIGSRSFSNKKEGEKILSVNDEEYTLKIISPGKVVVRYTSNENNKNKSKEITILEGEYGTLGGRDLYLTEVDVEAIAHVSLVPEVKNSKTEADFTFRIGIEKRAIELSPERTKRMLKNINETIGKWEAINEKLGTLIKGWKAACFATSAILMIKNMADGVSGISLARQKIMGKYKEICDTKDISRTQCYNDLSVEIDRDVNAMAKAMTAVNSRMDGAMEGNRQSGGILTQGSIIDQEAYKNSLRQQLSGWSTTVEGETITSADLTTTSQMRAALLSRELSGQGISGDVANIDLETTLRNVALIKKTKKERDEAAASLQSTLGANVDSSDIIILTNKETREYQWGGKTAADYPDAGIPVEPSRKTQVIKSGGSYYLLVLDQVNDAGRSGVSTVYKREGDSWSSMETNQFDNSVFYTPTSSGVCSNPWQEGKATITYYESGNNKGLPAIIPFDLSNGWYTMVSNSGGTFLDDTPQGYTQSGDVSYFKICNIGGNNIMEKGSGDDLCQSFSIHTMESVDKFIPCPEMTSSQVSELYTKAREAIRQASSQRGQKTVSILDQIMDVGAPMSQVGGFECQDFMSPDDCKFMFNVCDPVICPASRCDLGGKMPVSDVIQSGIIGSIALCLPNFQEGILVPICLSGIHAGLDTLVSILKSEQQCLERSLETGEHVGICDEITSIYLCEFFWRQISPIIDMMVPRVMESFIGALQGTRGGGEYMMIQHSWNNLQRSIDYFQGTYAPNAFRAFQARSVQEAGGEFCRAFVGTSLPTSVEALDLLLEPESPTQFYAQFSETLFTEATVPATSQYKVYYHIYAGNDKGVQYRVYLKNPPISSYYSTNPTVTVKTDYIPRGSAADESIDFTAPQGYKELCVVIDAQEECGFKQVTTDFGLNYIKSKYVEEQALAQDITGESECISGSPSAISMVNLNIQAGAEEVLNPEIALRGIVRVCASENPEAGVIAGDYKGCVEPEDCIAPYICSSSGICTDTSGNREPASSRWKDVGYCGESGIRCWLDSQSVKDDLEAVSAIEGKSISLLEEDKGLLENVRLGFDQVQKSLSYLRNKIKELGPSDLSNPEGNGVVTSIFQDLDLIIGTDDTAGAGTNANRAEALSLKATVYRMVVYELLKSTAPVSEPAGVEDVAEDETVEILGGSALSGAIDMVNEESSTKKEEPSAILVTWENLVDEGYGEVENGLRFLKLAKDSSLKAVKEFNEEKQSILLVVNNKEQTYSVSLLDGNIIFERIVG